MVDKRLFTLVPGVRKLVIGKIVFLWIGLLADIALAASIVGIIAPLVRYAGDDHMLAAADLDGGRRVCRHRRCALRRA